MNDLVVLDFDGVGTADDVLTKLRNMKRNISLILRMPVSSFTPKQASFRSSKQ